MRHRVNVNNLNRTSAHRKAMLRNMVISLFEHRRIKTTPQKAKSARRLAEKMITLGKRDTLHARRQAAAFLLSPPVLKKLFGTLAPRFADRPGGYTRIVRVGWRRGDGGEMALIHLIGSELKVKGKKEKKRKKEATPPEPVSEAAPEAESKE